jgi:hypothetical protein
MPFFAGQTLFAGPAVITVHDNGYVPGQFALMGIDVRGTGVDVFAGHTASANNKKAG